MARNNLTGTLPPSWGDMPRLERLDVSYNRIAGTVPEAWAKMFPHARSLFLTRNRLRGSLPAKWGAAVAGSKDFWRFDVRNNVHLRGCMPAGMERFTHSSAPFASVYFGGTLINRTCGASR